jgi:hypothetical protein
MSNARRPNPLKKVEPILRTYGLILESDQHLPSVVSAIVGKPIHGSWWGHPQGNKIYQALGILSQRPDLLLTKLLSRKTTFVQRKLWPEFLTIATSREPWQLDHLSANAQKLLDAVQRKGKLSTNEHSKESGVKIGVLGDAARELESRILVYGKGFHSEFGSHAKRLKTWDEWARDTKYKWTKVDLAEAKQSFENIALKLKNSYGLRPKLPWDKSSTSNSRVRKKIVRRKS